MPLWLCEWEACKQPAVQRKGDCLLCDEHLCRTHLHEPWHKCPNPERDWDSYSAQYSATEANHIDELCSRIDEAELCSRASTLRGGIPCTVDLSRKRLMAMMGNQNCHAEITFQDNVQWLARFRLTRTSSPPREVRNYILRSEVATMTYLQQHTKIPAPNIFDWGCESEQDSPLGVCYILMEKLKGDPLDWNSANPAQREHVMQQLVDIFIEIEKHPFDQMGSLLFSTGATPTVQIQGLAQQSTFRVGGGGPLGPFSSSAKGLRAVIKSYLAMIASGEIDACHPSDAYLMHRFRLDLIDNVWGNDASESQLFLKHPDDKGDHILVDDSFNIVGIIDWEWTQTVSKAEAFCSPCMMWPVGKFYKGSNELTADEMRLASIYRERGRQDLAACVIEGRKVQRFLFALGPDDTFSDHKTSTDLFMGLQRVFDLDYEGWELWKCKALEKSKDDDLLPGVLFD